MNGYPNMTEIKIGIECEYYLKYTNWIKVLAKENTLDYLIFVNHDYETDE